MKISILGTVGIPAAYGGFETLAENLARFHQDNQLSGKLIIYCSSKKLAARPASWLGAELRYIPLNANGVSSIPYDILSLFSAVWQRSDVILVLGVSGAIALPLVRLISKTRIVTNIDGLEWKREKWKKGFARWFLRFSERVAVWFSHEVIADNGGISAHVLEAYGRTAHVIAYGGDHVLRAEPKAYEGEPFPERYALALCRIEPENNIGMILEAFAARPELPLVFVGNWGKSSYGRALRQAYASHAHLQLLNPIYDLGVLHTVRGNAAVYVHGHSAGGTNPSLVEMMHFGAPVLAFDCVFNRFTTDEKAVWFKDAASLADAVAALTPQAMAQVGAAMSTLANERYTWRAVGEEYFSLLFKDQT